MSNKKISKVFDALEIRSTATQTSSQVDNDSYVVKTIIIENSLNQTVTFQCQGSANLDFSNSFNIGSSFDVAATTTSYATCDSYIPYWRVTATCSVAPTTGSLTVTAFGVG